ncbi:hypothetical protein HWV62_19681 [Athelia sp. TMB]|nr:hypothetical protein HWV62_19681 [Athelia sp. TMB]
MSNYTSAYPTGASYDPSLTELLETFYKSADLPPGEDQEVYVNSFTEDAILQIGDKINARGRDEIVQAKKDMWTYVARREHDPVQVFPGKFGDVDELMLHGSAKLWAREGGAESEINWSGHMRLAKQDGGLKIQEYHVHMVSTAAVLL